MKYKYIGTQNCRVLLPGFFNVRIMRNFDWFLGEVDSSEEYRGLIEKLIKKNRSTLDLKPWARFLTCDVEICYDMDFQTKQPQWRIQDYYKFSEGARSGFDRKINVMFSLIDEIGARWTFKMPLQYLLKGWGDASAGHQCYTHCIKLSGLPGLFGGMVTGESQDVEKCYSGITGRNWLKRLEEHLREVRQGGNKLFHRAWREAISSKSVVYHSYLQFVNVSYEEAMAWEERYVDEHSLAPKGFNMIPGGFEGNRHLHKHRVTDRINIDLEERDRAIAEYIRKNPRKGIPNPFISELWEDDNYYLKVIGSRAKTLTPDQVRQIRSLNSEGYSVEDITRMVDALNEKQVRNVLANRTYMRIH